MRKVTHVDHHLVLALGPGTLAELSASVGLALALVVAAHAGVVVRVHRVAVVLVVGAGR